MLRFNSNIISKLLPFALLVTVLPLGIWYFFDTKTKEIKSLQVELLKEIPRLRTQVNDMWTNGDLELLSVATDQNCQAMSIPNLKDEFLACNEVYLDCILKMSKKSHFKLINKNKKLLFQVLTKKKKLVTSEHQFSKIYLREEKTKEEFALILEKKCFEKKLPPKVYSATSLLSTEYLWDNFEQNVYIDKYYVNKLSIYLWSKKTLQPKLEEKYKNPKAWSDPVLDLPRKLQRKYCQDHGKKLLSSRVLDAASFYPGKNQASFKSPYPWQKGGRSFLQNKLLSKENCSNAFVRGCDKYLSWHNNSSVGMSWVGIAHTLGSHMESVDNSFKPAANLKVSSNSISARSPWHEVGLRATWDGVDFTSNNFKFENAYTKERLRTNIDKMEVAFRCMRVN